MNERIGERKERLHVHNTTIENNWGKSLQLSELAIDYGKRLDNVEKLLAKILEVQKGQEKEKV